MQNIIKPEFIRAIFCADWVNADIRKNPIYNIVYKSTKSALVLNGLRFDLYNPEKLSYHNHGELVFTVDTKGKRILPTINLGSGSYTVILYSLDTRIALNKINRLVKFMNSLGLQQQIIGSYSDRHLKVRS